MIKEKLIGKLGGLRANILISKKEERGGIDRTDKIDPTDTGLEAAFF